MMIIFTMMIINIKSQKKKLRKKLKQKINRLFLSFQNQISSIHIQRCALQLFTEILIMMRRKMNITES